MMVTFVSQCEKNALKKTRRVLDAFANRIGDNTWQTLITEDGLLTVKKMLRQTASKSTAVSCHWIRSRSRSQFLWVVGKQGEFNAEGVVPVNYSQVADIKMDETRNMNTNVYANTQKQPLAQHLFSVGYLAAYLVEKLIDEDMDNLKKSAFLAGCFHDLGKLDPEFRRWLDGKLTKKTPDEMPEDGLHIDKAAFSFDKHPRHNEISLWLMQFMSIASVQSNKKQRKFIEHAVYWHHAKPIRKDEYITLNDIHRKLNSAYKQNGLVELVEHVSITLKEVSELNNNYVDSLSCDLSKIKTVYDNECTEDFKEQWLPQYKQYALEDGLVDYVDQTTINAKANIIRACVISADRLISALSAQDLDNHYRSGTLQELVEGNLSSSNELIQSISDCLMGFEQAYPDSERNTKQAKAASQITDTNNVAVLNGPAGCGKTKIALEWAKRSEAKKIIWVCPRVQVCEGLYKDLIDKEYLPNTRIELCTGEFKYINHHGVSVNTEVGQEFSGDIVLTTIDQIINSITTHSNITAFIDFLSSHVVFDEYHEYIPMSAFNLLFAELVQAKKQMNSKANTLLVSATPNYSFIEHVLELDGVTDIDSFNQSLYQITFKPFDESLKDNTNPLFCEQPNNTIVISNTATTAQQAFLANQEMENAIVFHGKYRTADKIEIFSSVYNCFKKSGSKVFSLLRSGPIVQASLNITCEHMVTEFTVAENWLQRLGRLDRFGENASINEFITAIPQEIIDSNGKVKGNCAKFLNNTHSYRSAYAWLEFLQEELTGGSYTVNQIYHLYKRFYQSNKGQEAVEQDLITALKSSVKVINKKVHDPIRFIKKPKANTKKKLKKSSLRGDSRFVQMAIVETKGRDVFEVLNQYAITWQESDSDFSNCYTESLDVIRNSGLVDYMAQKHGRIDDNSVLKGIPAKQSNIRKQVLEGAAIAPEYPLYLSYTPSDLSEKLGEETPEESAIYYVVGKKQIIGAMALDKLNF